MRLPRRSVSPTEDMRPALEDADLDTFRERVCAALAVRASGAELESDLIAKVRAFLRNGTVDVGSMIEGGEGQGSHAEVRDRRTGSDSV